jgi:hypothetical protein
VQLLLYRKGLSSKSRITLKLKIVLENFGITNLEYSRLRLVLYHRKLYMCFRLHNLQFKSLTFYVFGDKKNKCLLLTPYFHVTPLQSSNSFYIVLLSVYKSCPRSETSFWHSDVCIQSHANSCSFLILITLLIKPSLGQLGCFSHLCITLDILVRNYH